MKKRLSVCAALMCAVLLAGCGGKTNPPTRGTWDGSVYHSDYSGLTFAAPDGWSVLDDEEIAAMTQVGLDAFGDEGGAFSAEALEKTTIYDAVASNSGTGSTVMIAYENLSVNPLGLLVGGDEYLEAVKSQINEAQDMFTYEFGEVGKQTISGMEFSVLGTEVPEYGISQYYYANKKDGFITCIIATAVGNDTIDDIMACFS